MKTSAMPKTAMKWIEQNAAKVDEYWIERDGFDPNKGPYSIWLFLENGWCNGDFGSHTIHEASAGDFLEAVRYIAKCTCDGCTN